MDLEGDFYAFGLGLRSENVTDRLYDSYRIEDFF